MKRYSVLMVVAVLLSALPMDGCGAEETSPSARTRRNARSGSTGNPIVRDSMPSGVPASMPVARIDTVRVGDLDGDRMPDTAWVDWPDNDTDKGVWEITRIRFSADVPVLVDSSSIGGALAALADLDENGTDELVFLPDWPTSCWAGMRVYGLRGQAWKMLGGGSFYRCNDNAYSPDSLRRRVIKIRKGEFDLMQDIWTDDGEMTRTAKRFTIN